MIRTLFAAVAAAALGIGIVNANEIAASKTKFVKLDHVFLIMMENQTDTDILGNSNAPFINSYANVANQAKNYFAVGHPSAPNYLEIVGGSNFGLTNDYWPNWVNGGCVDNAPGSTGCVNDFTPIAVAGLDNTVVATATNTSQCNGQVNPGDSPVPNNCALYTYNSTSFTPKSIADQLVAAKKSWKTYQESLPMVVPGVDGINYSDGAFSNLSPVAVFGPGPIQKLYAVKHNPFAYFKNIEQGTTTGLSFAQVQDFDGPQGLWADLATGDVPNFSFIVPNQCHDMHGFVSGGTPICSANTDAEAGYLMLQGDAEVKKLVTGIKASEAWQKGKNVIILVWDENDYSNSANRVVMLVETSYGKNGGKSTTPYDHFSLLRTLEAGFGLPCLNHACDSTSLIMNDMFGN
jgi:phosphatidylinositol-3-phosphatase